MNTQPIILNRIYHLDVGSSTPIEILTLSFNDEGVWCEYRNSTPDRKENISYEVFEMNGYKRLSDKLEFSFRTVNMDIRLPFDILPRLKRGRFYDANV